MTEIRIERKRRPWWLLVLILLVIMAVAAWFYYNETMRRPSTSVQTIGALEAESTVPASASDPLRSHSVAA